MKNSILLSIMCITSIFGSGCHPTKHKDLTLLVGTYTNGTSEGIYTYRIDPDDLSVEALSQHTIDNPSYLAISDDGKFVYAVSESGADNSAVSAFRLDKEKGSLELINRVKVDSNPCYILLDKQQNAVVTANYSGGSVSFVSLDAKGALVDPGFTLRYEGSGPDSSRQSRSHLHCVAISPDQEMLIATDLGGDRLYRYERKQQVQEGEIPYIDSGVQFDGSLEPGSGPRHLIFNKKGSLAYLINELSGMVTVFSVDTQKNFQTIQSILADSCHARGSADIHLSPDEKYLYVSTRLQGDGITIFRTEQDGKLSKVAYQPTGKHPRNFIITPDGSLLLVACKEEGMIQFFSIDKETGLLKDTGKRILLDQPVCLKFVNNTK